MVSSEMQTNLGLRHDVLFCCLPVSQQPLILYFLFDYCWAEVSTELFIINSEIHSLVIIRLQPHQQNKHAEQGQQQGSRRETFKNIL